MESDKSECKVSDKFSNFAVTPRVGVWIEILVRIYCLLQPNVTPRVGVWIEIYYWPGAAHSACVTPRVGVWIEISYLPVLQEC